MCYKEFRSFLVIYRRTYVLLKKSLQLLVEILIREFKARSDELFSCSKDIKEFFNISPKQFNTADKFKALTKFIKKYKYMYEFFFPI